MQGIKGRVAVVVIGVTLGSLAAVSGPAQAATIKVDSIAVAINDDDNCSLREAMISANKNISRDSCEKGEASRDTIRLRTDDFSSPFLLTGEGTEEDESKLGDLDYTGGGPLTIQGKGEDKTLINATISDNRVLHATGNARALTVRDVSIFNGTAPTDNPLGGNILVESGALTLDRVTVDGGTAEVGGGLYFLGVEEPRKDLTITRSLFNENTAEDGGGISMAVFEGARAKITKSTFTANTAVGQSLSEGGAILSNSDKIQIADSLFEENVAEAADEGDVALGGAIAVRGSYEHARIDRSTFSENAAAGAGDITAQGGAVFASGIETKIVNSTFFDNASATIGGAVHGDALVTHSTFLSNSADEGGDHVSATGFPVVLRNSILPGAQIAVDVCEGPAESQGFNVFTYDDSDCGTLDSDVSNGGNAGLVGGPPMDNGGATPTIALSAKAIAKDLVPKSNCKPAKGEDQRGYERPEGPRCDAGAFEEAATPK